MSQDLASRPGAGDREHELVHQVQSALDGRYSLEIVGSGSKRFYGRRVKAQPLAVGAHCGIVEYEPTELVITARCGTPLKEIEAELAAHKQMLAFEPPHFGPGATLGGAVASGLSGPRRPFAGSLRDFVLGVKLINGKAESLSFGGRVMKNVAGFDISRLMVGAMGTLGVVLEVSLKVLPRPETECSLCFESDAASALERMNRWVGEGLPISAACHADGRLWLRLSGAESSLSGACRRLGGELMGDGEVFWRDLLEQRLPFFQGAAPLWRLSVKPLAPLPELAGEWLLDWGGAQRWLRSSAAPDEVFAAAARLEGHAACFRGAADAVFQPLPSALLKLHQRIKHAFDPEGVFNVGRLYPAW